MFAGAEEGIYVIVRLYNGMAGSCCSLSTLGVLSIYFSGLPASPSLPMRPPARPNPILTLPSPPPPLRCLEASSYFGLEPCQVHVFAPDVTVPLLGEDGKVAMESPYKVARAPGGSGE